MSDKSEDLGWLLWLVIVVLIAINIGRILYKIFRYWDRHIAPTIEALFQLILWAGGIALAGFITWRFTSMIYGYLKERMIILRGEYAALLNDIADLRKALSKTQGEATYYENQAWQLRQEIETLTLKLKKATARPESVIDNLVSDIVGGA